MDDATGAPRTCRVCDAPIRATNTFGICDNLLKPECQKARLRERRERRRGGAPELRCRVCGGSLRFGNTTGICSGTNATSECKRERKNLERIAAGLPPYEPAEDVTEVRAGDTFGLWTVMEDGRGLVSYVLCQCKCGDERPVTIARLTEGKSASCGRKCKARRASDPYLLPGIYGNLEVLEAGLRAVDEVRVHCNRCGRNKTKQAFLIKRGITKSCGCGSGKFTHGLSRHPLWHTWDGMRDRCTRPTAKGYNNYGACGITVCAGWTGAPEGFLSWVADMGERPEGMTIDRIDPEGGYWCGHCAECARLRRTANCRWATKAVQSRNKRRVGKLTQQRNAAMAEVERLNQLLAQTPAAPMSRKRRVPPAGMTQGALF
jgi:hypothetical protein